MCPEYKKNCQCKIKHIYGTCMCSVIVFHPLYLNVFTCFCLVIFFCLYSSKSISYFCSNFFFFNFIQNCPCFHLQTNNHIPLTISLNIFCLYLYYTKISHTYVKESVYIPLLEMIGRHSSVFQLLSHVDHGSCDVMEEKR